MTVVNRLKCVRKGAAATCLAAMFSCSAWGEAPQSFSLLGVIRDFPPESQHVDFLVHPSATPGARSAGNVALTLDPDKKPVYTGGGRRVTTEWRDGAGNKIAWCAPAQPSDQAGQFSGNDTGGISSSDSFSQWFRDVPGINMSRPWTITLDRNVDGEYVYDTSDFHPIDHQLLGNGPDEHNFYFTYEIVCTFTAAPGLFIEFTGDDDCWIYIDGRLGIDHGGIAANRQQRIDLDRFGLSAGQEYEVRFFFAERKQPQSQFRLATNIEMQSTGIPSIFANFD